MPLPFADDRQRQEALIAHLVTAGYIRCEPPILQPASAFFDSGEDMRGRLYLTSDMSGSDFCLRPEYTIPVSLQYLASPSFGGPAAYPGASSSEFCRAGGKLSEFQACHAAWKDFVENRQNWARRKAESQSGES